MDMVIEEVMKAAGTDMAVLVKMNMRDGLYKEKGTEKSNIHVRHVFQLHQNLLHEPASQHDRMHVPSPAICRKKVSVVLLLLELPPVSIFIHLLLFVA